MNLEIEPSDQFTSGSARSASDTLTIASKDQPVSPAHPSTWARPHPRLELGRCM